MSNESTIIKYTTNESRFEFQTASRMYEENIIPTPYLTNQNDISTVSKGMNIGSTEMTKGIKSSHKYFVTCDCDTNKNCSKMILLIHLQSQTQL